MKYVLAGLAVVAAVAALLVRPPIGGRGPDNVPTAEPAPAADESPSAAAAARRPPAGRIVVYIAGEVKAPGVYSLPAGSRAEAALARGGGPKPDADLVAVNLAAPLADGEEVIVPPLGATPATSRRATRRPGGRASRSPRRRHRRHRAPADAANAADAADAARGSGSADVPLHSIDLNAAGADVLETLPGIGPALAARIVAYRDSNGPFTSTDELGDVTGITPRLQDALAAYVFIR